MTLRIPTAAIMLAAVLGAGCGHPAYRLRPATMVPAATGEVKTSRDSNGNTVFELKVEHLAKPGNLTPPRRSYVVWTEASGSAPRNEGQLAVGDDLRGEFRGLTPLRAFDVIVTAEDDPTPSRPGEEILRATVRTD